MSKATNKNARRTFTEAERKGHQTRIKRQKDARRKKNNR